ncbi:MAG TPA: poly(R)-hydroxyalkanoic acid synthase subunit PhaE [Beijerinckiaceae bacterium]|nr:poly(R)-hydroxyalkanoic acid synthase subunit PhaE [Beijerinckiaceae bacterium]
MDPLAYMRGVAELWGQGGKAFAEAQQAMLSGMAESMKVSADGQPPGFPGLAGSGELAAANAAFTQLWSSASELSATITKGVQAGEKPDPLVAEMLGRIFDPGVWFSAGNMDEALQRLAEGPRLADLWDVERKFLSVFNAWVALRRRSLEHNTVMLEAWMRAAGAFAKRLNEMADASQSIESPRKLLTLWVETANDVMLETQRSEPFLNTQREILTASTELRLAQQEVAAFYSEMFGYPTRTELDDVHKTVTELRRELRALKRQMRGAAPVRQAAGAGA